mmetsp:Transcript_9429/g.14007  ORF Transcript_9429/g.14007 Transcript_9429/m.14007 type:complete len:472 (+) Transcript_9429:57-1472(+)
MTKQQTLGPALATLTLPKKESSDPLLYLLAALASPKQLTTQKKTAIELNLNGTVITQRNAILRALCTVGPLDIYPLCLLGQSSVAGLVEEMAVVMSNVHSWMSIAATIGKSKKEAALDAKFLNSLNDHLNNFAFLAGTPQPSLADWTVYFSMNNVSVDLNEILQSSGRAVQRWYDATQCSVHDAAESVKDIFNATLLPPIIEFQVQNMLPVFHYPTTTTLAIISTGGSGDNSAADAATADESKADEKGGTKKDSKKAPQQQQSSGGELTDEQKKAAADKRAKKAAEKAAKKKNKAPAAKQEGSDEYNISAFDIRVGKILKAWEHPEADKLFCEEIDVGEDKPRQIASGLRPFYKLEEMQNQRVLVLCNLKARPLLGFASHGMVLCASNADHTSVEFAVPPEDAAIGERVMFDSFEGDPEAENKMNKKKILEKVAPDLKTNGDGIVVWKGKVSKTSAGPCKAINGMKDAQVA